MFKKFIRKCLPQDILNILKKVYAKHQFRVWEKAGRPVPPPHIVKQMAIEEQRLNSGYKILVETGTYMGDMVEAQKRNFRHIYSIELGRELYQKAIKRFRRDKNITIVQGDSGKMLADIMIDINEPAIFWLDGHYSAGVTARGDKDCPVFEELDAIMQKSRFNHILLIDDARCFTGEGDYPSIDELTTYIRQKDNRYQVTVKDDIIRCSI